MNASFVFHIRNTLLVSDLGVIFLSFHMATEVSLELNHPAFPILAGEKKKKIFTLKERIPNFKHLVNCLPTFEPCSKENFIYIHKCIYGVKPQSLAHETAFRCSLGSK